MSSVDPRDTAPPALFLAPDAERTTTDTMMSREQYRRAVAECIQLAAAKGMADARWLTRPGKEMQPLTALGPALLLLDRLIESDQNKRAWLAVEQLAPELNYCVEWLRRYQRVETFMQDGHEHLAVLRGSITVFGTEPDLKELSAEERTAAREAAASHDN
jgi:hypothetical protein